MTIRSKALAFLLTLAVPVVPATVSIAKPLLAQSSPVAPLPTDETIEPTETTNAATLRING
jgi:hypothetical protein